MTAALVGFLIGVAGTYLAMTQHYDNGDADEFRALLRELKGEETEAASG